MEAVRSAGTMIGLIRETALFCGWKVRVKLSPEGDGGQAGRRRSPQPNSSYVAVGLEGKGAGPGSLGLEFTGTNQLILQRQRLDMLGVPEPKDT